MRSFMLAVADIPDAFYLLEPVLMTKRRAVPRNGTVAGLSIAHRVWSLGIPQKRVGPFGSLDKKVGSL